jgi:YebC/PmpR family DNA-binding regulatory protein
MSGHNKWSKIKHKKAASDAKKSKVFSKHARLIAVESRLTKGDRNSPALRAAIERAKADSMPSDNIDRAVEKGRGGDGAAMQAVIYEMYGPGGVAIIATALTDNSNRTSQEIKHLLSKQGFELGVPGSAAWAFKKEGTRFVPTTRMELDEQSGETLATLIEALEEHDDIQDVFTSADDAD